jgi:hypothetical protein
MDSAAAVVVAAPPPPPAAALGHAAKFEASWREYAAKHNVDAIMQAMLVSVIKKKPSDPVEHLIDMLLTPGALPDDATSSAPPSAAASAAGGRRK